MVSYGSIKCEIIRNIIVDVLIVQKLWTKEVGQCFGDKNVNDVPTSSS